MRPEHACFKVCPSCRHEWATRHHMLTDPEVSFVGYQAWVQDGVLGLFLFDHLPCSTTMAVSARLFEDMRPGSTYEHRDRPPAEVPGYCLSGGTPAGCPPRCECDFVAQYLAHLD